jgi:hypothetical protein
MISYFAFFVTQGCCNAYFAESLFEASTFSILPTKSIASLEIVDQSFLSNINLPALTLASVSLSFLPANGG